MRPEIGKALRQWAKSRARLLLLPLLALVLILLAFALDRATSRGRVLRGVTIGGIAASGLDAATLARRVNEVAVRLEEQRLALRLNGQVRYVPPAEVGFRVDGERSVEAALAAGRSGSLLQQVGFWLRRWAGVEALPLTASVDDAMVRSVVADFGEVAIVEAPFPGGLVYEAGKVQLRGARTGQRVNHAGMSERVLAALLDGQGSVLDVPVVSITPGTRPDALARAKAQAEQLVAGRISLTSEDGGVTISLTKAQLGRALSVRVLRDDLVEVGLSGEVLDKLLDGQKRQLESPPRDATVEFDKKDQPRVVPGRPGTLLSTPRVAEALVLAAYSPARQGVLPLLRGAEPSMSTDDLLALHITKLVSRFTTFHPCCQPRVANIHRIADLMNGAIVKPGEYFSVNAHVGPRTTRNGFVAAPTIEEGEMVDALGGGASQFATTIFNALFYGAYDIIERQPHSYYFSRYPMGIEATLSFPKPDIIFRNDTEAGMLIRCEYTETSITVKIYGDNGGRKVRATRSGQFDIEKPTVELIPNEELEPDREKVKESGQLGWSLIVGRVVTFPDGSHKEEKRKVTYRARVRRVEVHPCRIPEGEPGYTGEKCPIPEAGADADIAPLEPAP
ncbi:MAG: VanW family protein [Polyangiaceae bacterium]